MGSDNPDIPKQNPPKWEWRIMTAHVDIHGKLRFDDIEYCLMSEKSVLSSLRKEGWEFVRVVPFGGKSTEEQEHDGTISKKGFWSGWLKRSRASTDKTDGPVNAYFYYFKRSKQE